MRKAMGIKEKKNQEGCFALMAGINSAAEEV